jgi:hypothetical protein
MTRLIDLNEHSLPVFDVAAITTPQLLDIDIDVLTHIFNEHARQYFIVLSSNRLSIVTANAAGEFITLPVTIIDGDDNIGTLIKAPDFTTFYNVVQDCYNAYEYNSDQDITILGYRYMIHVNEDYEIITEDQLGESDIYATFAFS